MQLLIQDDEQNPEVAQRVTRDLIAQGVVALIGPADQRHGRRHDASHQRSARSLISPTVVTNELTGKDDYFLRVSAPTREYVRKIALHEPRGACGG
ncbi:MAG: hypothetical protein U1F70_10820 [Candidatus Competibacteraceae bacterium]